MQVLKVRPVPNVFCYCLSEGFGSDCLLCFSLEAEDGLAYSANLSGNEDAISLSDIVPETKICFVSRVAASDASTVLNWHF